MNVRAPGHAAVHSVVVSFNPDPEHLAALVAAVAPQVDRVFVVDNGSAADVAQLLHGISRVEVVPLGRNFGIAYAQNVGLQRALAGGAQFVLLLDDDSLPSASMVSDLLGAFAAGSANGEAGRVAAVGPTTVDLRTGHASYFWCSDPRRPYRWTPSGGEGAGSCVQVEFLIASGTLLCGDAVRAVGGMRSEYFIDQVDTEWCFRAKAAGFRILGAPAARLQHRLGDRVRTVWFLRRRRVMEHSALRDYYMFRNTLLMLRDTPFPRFWALHFLGRLFQFFGYGLLLAGGRMNRLRLMTLGLVHGARGRTGRLDAPTSTRESIPATDLDPPLACR